MIKAELLTETTEQHFLRMLLDGVYGFQEKHNGHRLTICKQNGILRPFNREGEPSSKPLHPHVKSALLNHPLSTFVLDGELVKNTCHVFDVLYLDDEDLIHHAYEYREARYHSEFEDYSPYIQPVKTARTPQEKRVLWDAVLAHHGEGIVSKNMNAPYRQGRTDTHWKLKFWKTCDVVVMGKNPDDKDSVEIGLYDERGNLHRVSGCSLRNKFRPKVGSVLEVRFLYATKERHIVQPTLMSIRLDKPAKACKLSQLEPYINKNWRVTQ